MGFEATTCPYCSCGCGLLLNVKDDRLIGTHPSRAHPIANGSLCIRGWNCVDAPYHRERLNTAMVRRHGTLVPVRPDEAVTEIVARVKSADVPHRAHADGDKRKTPLLFAVGPTLANEDVLAVKRLAQLLRADACSTDLTGVQVARRAIKKVLGREYTPTSLDLLAGADLVWIFGADLDNFPQVASRVVQASRAGARLVQFDVYSSCTVGDNATAVAVPPDAFGMLPLALHSAAFELNELSPRVNDAYGASSMLAGNAPLPASQPWLTCDVAKKLVSELLAARSPAIVIGERWLSIPDGVRHTSALLQALALMGVENRVLLAAGEAGSWGACDVLQEEDDRPSRLLEFLHSESTDVSVLFLVGDDLTRRFARRDAIAKKLSAIDTVIVIDRFQTESLQFAHVALPSCAFGEVDGTLTNAFGTVQRWRKAVSPQGDSCPERVWMSRIGQQLGFDRWPVTPEQWLAALQAEVPAYRSAPLRELYATDAPFGVPVQESGHLTFAAIKTAAAIPHANGFTMQLLFAAHPAQWSTGVLSQKEELLKREVIDSKLFVSTSDLKKAGFKAGETVKVVTPDTEGLLSLREDTRLPEGVAVAVPLAGSQASTLRGFYPDPAGQTMGLQPVSARLEKV